LNYLIGRCQQRFRDGEAGVAAKLWRDGWILTDCSELQETPLKIVLGVRSYLIARADSTAPAGLHRLVRSNAGTLKNTSLLTRSASACS
jgi:hypothetical protein